MNLRPQLTYANVVATLALILAVGGGTVYAASELGKNDVKSKNIAKGAVKGADLGNNAVTSPKLKNGSITADDIATGVIPKFEADVTGSAAAAAQAGLNTASPAPLPLTGTTAFTPHAGEVVALAAEGKFTFATTNNAQPCSPRVRLFLNGEPTRIFVSPDADATTTTVTSSGRDADGPFGLITPEQAQTITATLQGDPTCTATSQLDNLEVRILQIK